jgi:FkbM family methyltransferase
VDLSFLKEGRAFRTLIDVGANDGASGEHLQGLFRVERVISFEPLPNRAQQVRERGFELHPVALDDQAGDGTLIRNKYDPASSLLPMTRTTLDEWSGVVEEVESIPVKRARLDDEVGEIALDLIIKVDAQGAETKIIDGGQRIFGLASVVLIETNFVPLYHGEGRFNEIHARLAKLGFQLSGFRSQHLAKVGGRPLFAHCIYERHSGGQ